MMKLRKETNPEDSNIHTNILDGITDIHVHTAPDVRLRIQNDIEAAETAKDAHMAGIVIKSHNEPTSGRAKIASTITDFPVYGGVVLNQSVGGLNPLAVQTCADMGGKFVWFPTVSAPSIELEYEKIEAILHIVAENSMVLLTGHLKPDKIFDLVDMARSNGVWKVVVNHPLTRVVGASLDEQVEMSRHAYLEHCFVACMKQHDNLDPSKITDSIKKVGSRRCIISTDFGQIHNLNPVDGMKMYISTLIDKGIKKSEIQTMGIENPKKLIK
jgi:hypothetical protein